MYRAGQEFKLLAPNRITLSKVSKQTEGLCLTIKSGDNGGEEHYTDVTVHQMFPLSHPDHLVTLCDKYGNEIGVLVEPEALDEASRQALAQELELSYFIPKIQRIQSIKEEYGVIHWVVDTDRGPREFDVQSRYDIRFMGNNRFIVRDMDGNRYDIPDMTALDAESRALLEMEV